MSFSFIFQVYQTHQKKDFLLKVPSKEGELRAFNDAFRDIERLMQIR
jgi:hypothetical protein